MPCAARSRWRRRLRAGSLRGGSLAARWPSSTCTPRPTTSSSPPIATWPSGKWRGRSPCRCCSPVNNPRTTRTPSKPQTHTTRVHARLTRSALPCRCCSRPAMVRPAMAAGFGTRSTGAFYAVHISAISPLHLPYVSPTSRQERLRCGRARVRHGPLARAGGQGGAERGECYRVAAGRAHCACPHGRAERARGAQRARRRTPWHDECAGGGRGARIRCRCGRLGGCGGGRLGGGRGRGGPRDRVCRARRAVGGAGAAGRAGRACGGGAAAPAARCAAARDRQARDLTSTLP